MEKQIKKPFKYGGFIQNIGLLGLGFILIDYFLLHMNVPQWLGFVFALMYLVGMYMNMTISYSDSEKFKKDEI